MLTNKAGGHGFSLLELLLVLVIVGFIAGLAGLSVSSGSRPYVVEGSVTVFADTAQYAMDEAQLAGMDMGLLLRQESGRETDVYSYEWLQRQPVGWRPPVNDSEIFQARKFPVDVELLLEVEEGAPELASDFENKDADALQPQVIFYSSGETTPGTLTLVDAEGGDTLWVLEWDLVGRMTLRRKGIEEDEP
jgi:general secretion pathway protein H